MLRCCRAKSAQHADLRRDLVATGAAGVVQRRAALGAQFYCADRETPLSSAEGAARARRAVRIVGAASAREQSGQ